MATNTAHYNLVKLDLNDPADITQFSNNMDAIDERLYKLSIGDIKSLEKDMYTDWHTFLSNIVSDMPEGSTQVCAISIFYPDEELSLGTWLMEFYRGWQDFVVEGINITLGTKVKTVGTLGGKGIKWLIEHPIDYGTVDLTAGSSILETGRLYFVYE